MRRRRGGDPRPLRVEFKIEAAAVSLGNANTTRHVMSFLSYADLRAFTGTNKAHSAWRYDPQNKPLIDHIWWTSAYFVRPQLPDSPLGGIDWKRHNLIAGLTREVGAIAGFLDCMSGASAAEATKSMRGSMESSLEHLARGKSLDGQAFDRSIVQF